MVLTITGNLLKTVCIDGLSFYIKMSYNRVIKLKECQCMKFTANVKVRESEQSMLKQQETERAKKLLLEAIRIFSKNDVSIEKEAEAFLKEAEVNA